MRRTKIWVRTLSVFLVGALSWIGWNIYPLQAGDNELTRKLVSLVGDDEREKWKEASSLYASIAMDSTYKSVATQAMALIQIRQGNYSDAWKLLNSQSSQLASAPTPFRAGHEKLMLWLWLEAKAADKAEAQFNRLVMIALNKELPDPERRDICYFLGGVIGMLQSSSDTSSVAAATLEQGRASLEKVESKIALEQFRTGLESATQWHRSLQARLNEFTQADPKQAESVLTGLKLDFDNKSSELTQLLAELRQEKTDLKTTDDLVRKLVRNKKSLEDAWKTPTPGRPPQPIPPLEPTKPRTVYETIYTTDAKTGKRTATGRQETDASRRAANKYNLAMTFYVQKKRDYDVDVQSYPARLAVWTQMDLTRRSTLQENRKKTDAELAIQQPMLDKREAKVKAIMASSKSLESELRLLKANIAIAAIAKQKTESKPTEPGTMLKPSHFELLEWESEIYRLERCLRETR